MQQDEEGEGEGEVVGGVNRSFGGGKGGTGSDYFSEVEKNTVNLLIAGDSEGYIYMIVYGIYSLQPILLTQSNLKVSKIIKASVTSDLSILTLIYTTTTITPNQEKESEKKKHHQLVVTTFKTGLLHTHKNQILALSHRYTSIKFISDYIRESLDKVKNNYLTVKTIYGSYFDKFQKIIDEHHDGNNNKIKMAKSNMSGEFVVLLATGKPTKLLMEFMEVCLKKRELKEWENKVNKAFSEIQSLIDHYINTGFERLLLELNSLIGYSKWPQKFKGFGLSEKLIQSRLIIASSLTPKIEEFSLFVDEESNNFKDFIHWLQYEFDKVTSTSSLDQTTPDSPPLEALNSIDIIRVSKFIKESLNLNKLEKNIDLWKFIDDLLNFCDEFSTSTAQNNNVEEKIKDDDDDDDEMVDDNDDNEKLSSIISKNSNNKQVKDNDTDEEKDEDDYYKEIEKQKFLIDSIILKQENSIYFQYIIFYIYNYSSKTNNNDDDESIIIPSVLWILRFPLNNNNVKEEMEEEENSNNVVEIAYIQLKNQEIQTENIKIVDLKIFNEEKLHLIISSPDKIFENLNISNAQEEIREYLIEINYVKDIIKEDDICTSKQCCAYNVLLQNDDDTKLCNKNSTAFN
ncbi:366_t:CDS:2 [Entrophospora sp. SA101]|nr:366_t:CDS:2 [Entrophospora sp. SA101]